MDRLTLSNLEETTNMKKRDMKLFAWGMGAGAIVLLIVIFSAGWVVTSGSAEAKAEEMVTEAVLDRLAPIAFAQFMQDPNKEEHIKELGKLEYYGSPNRSDYVEKQGWATMPGEQDPDSRVAYECAKRIMALEE
jgi:heme A synthase